MKAVIFAGGVGTRLWPLSRRSSPKQFEKIIGSKSTLQLAVERLIPSFKWEDIYIATGVGYVKLVLKQLPKILPDHVIGEPQMRDVGPAVGLMTAILYKNFPKTPVVILWSDHLVRREELFRQIILKLEEFINKNHKKIVFIAQKPRFANQNLGWIEFGKIATKINELPLYSFRSFKYRPDIKTAVRYCKSGYHAWNLGYFVTTPEFLWQQYRIFAPEMYKNLQIIQNHYGTNRFENVLNEIYPKLEKISFDNLILEKIKAQDALVVSENLEWSDVGTWDALKEALQRHATENITLGKVLVTDCEDSLVYNYTNQLVTAIDLKGLLIINTKDVMLICHKNSVPKIKKLVESFSGTKNEHLT